MRNSLFGIIRRFEAFNKVDDRFTEHIQIFYFKFCTNPLQNEHLSDLHGYLFLIIYSLLCLLPNY